MDAVVVKVAPGGGRVGGAVLLEQLVEFGFA